MTNELLKEIIFELEKRKIVKANGCWVLSTNTNPQGYSEIRFKYQLYHAHRVSASYYLNLDYDDKTQLTLHKNTCNNPACWNYEHLYIGTQHENMKDAKEMGWKPFGEINKNKTHCSICNFPFNEENTDWVCKGTKRQCKNCNRRRQREYQERKRNRIG